MNEEKINGKLLIQIESLLSLFREEIEKIKIELQLLKRDINGEYGINVMLKEIKDEVENLRTRALTNNGARKAKTDMRGVIVEVVKYLITFLFGSGVLWIILWMMK